SQLENYTIFKYSKPVPVSIPVEDEHDPACLVLLPFYSQKASAGEGEEPTQLGEIVAFIPIVKNILRGVNPTYCGITQVKGDSMTDIGLFSGDLVIFNTKQTDGDGIYVITINGVTRIKRLENRPIEKKIIISSENTKRYPTPEILTYEQATEMLTVHGKVIGWIHRHFY
ncbi:MAG: S24 family peptidase, partial [Treponemataceae bacterium]